MKQNNIFGLPTGRTLSFEQDKKGRVSNPVVYFVDENNMVEVLPLKKEDFHLDMDALTFRYINYRKAKEQQVREMPNFTDALLATHIGFINAAEQAAIKTLEKVYKTLEPKKAK